MARKNYNNQVFINCPFDDSYLDLYRACIFVILDSGFIPRCSREEHNATQSRLDKIVEIIANCRYGIHDLSRVELDSKSNLPRFNMPFELGIFYSAKHLGDNTQKKKNCLILEKEQYRYQVFISDISGIDITPHNNSHRDLIIEIRNWLHTSSKRKSIPPANSINAKFDLFQSDMKKTCDANNTNYDTMPFIELLHSMTDWIKLYDETHESLFNV